jgi:hypothetical protein
METRPKRESWREAQGCLGHSTFASNVGARRQKLGSDRHRDYQQREKGNPKSFAVIRDTIDGRPTQEVDMLVALRSMSEAEINARVERLLAKAKK